MLSVVALSLQLVVRARPVKRLLARFSKANAETDDLDDIEATGSGSQPSTHVARLGGPVIYLFKVLRLLSTLALLGLAITSLILNGREENFEYSFDSRWIAFGFIGTYVRTPPCLSDLWLTSP